MARSEVEALIEKILEPGYEPDKEGLRALLHAYERLKGYTCAFSSNVGHKGECGRCKASAAVDRAKARLLRG